MHVPLHQCRQPIYSDDSQEEEDLLYDDHRPVRGGGTHGRDY